MENIYNSFEEYNPDGIIERKVKARKDYQCDCCETQIKTGTVYIFGRTVSPRYDDNDNQIGIEYISWRLHLYPDYCEQNLSQNEINKF